LTRLLRSLRRRRSLIEWGNKNLLSLVRALASVVREAGAFARAASANPIKTWVKEHNSPVSEVDIAVNQLLKERLTALVPDAGWLSEESEDDPARLAVSRLWIVDPIDGTRSFIAGRPDWTISVALVEGSRPVVAGLYAPVSEELFLAVAGGGATRNGTPIKVTPGDMIDGARIAGPRGFLDRLATVVPALVVLPKIQSLALRLARVADGTLDAALASRTSRDWDLAAADLLVHEAGGALTTVGGAKVAYNRVSTIHDDLIAAGLVRHQTLAVLLRNRPDLLR
jgi:myo-inositol-1(or 4)-monophosphatase